ncbi:hypothetical protein, partial [uncultured Dialister sp.]|uniref:hypothetical protein n=1 Tax=uncultured Dialister sp. TaxID=278064 RepID=UPI002675BE52
MVIMIISFIYLGHACGVRVQRVQRVWWRLTPQILKKGRGSAAGCVEGLHPTGETTHYDLCVAGAPSNHVR